MTIYQVSYSRIDWNLYFSGSMQCYYTATKLFSTSDAAAKFVADGLYEWVPTWRENVCVKDPGAGKIEEILLE